MRGAPIITFMSAVAVATSGPSIPAYENAMPRCHGKKATIIGTPGDDVLIGSPTADVIAGLGGDDALRGQSGDDALCAGRGDDRIAGARGNDRMNGGRGNGDAAVFRGGGGLTNAYLKRPGCECGIAKTPGLGRDELRGLEQLVGQERYGDRLHGDGGDNRLVGRGGPDTLQGRAGDDRLVAGRGTDAVDGGAGEDECLRAEETTNCESE